MYSTCLCPPHVLAVALRRAAVAPAHPLAGGGGAALSACLSDLITVCLSICLPI
jgi:hypothetical protein